MSLRVKIMLTLLWLALCTPLLFLGYGSDFDAWRVAQSAADIWDNHFYTPSRSLGNPLHEFAVAPLVTWGGWIAANSFSLLFGLLFLLALFRLDQHGHFRHPVLVIVATTFLPIFMSNSASTMDYIPALALLTWSYVHLRESRWNMAALMLGIACGFRPTSILFLAPLIYYTHAISNDRSRTLRTAVLAVLWALVFYAPMLAAENFVFPKPVHRGSMLIHFAVAGFHALRLFGMAQTMIVALVILFFTRKIKVPFWHMPFSRFHVLNIGIWLGLFLFLPDTPEYLLPAVPSSIFIADRLLSRNVFTAMALILLSYHAVQFDLRGVNPANLKLKPRVRNGWSIEDIQDRRFKLSFRDVVNSAHMDQPTVLMYGLPWATAVNKKWQWDSEWNCFRKAEGSLFLSYAITDSMTLHNLRNHGYRIVAWRSAQWENIQRGRNDWLDGVEIVKDIRILFSGVIQGRALNER